MPGFQSMLKPPSAYYSSSNSKTLIFFSYAHSRKLEKYRKMKKEKYECNQVLEV